MPVLLFVLSLIGLAISLFLPGWHDLILLAGPMVLTSAILLIRARPGWVPASKTVSPPKSGRHVVVDGSNVLHWRDETPDITTVREVVMALQARGFTPGVMFDANVGYKIGDRYQDDAEIARRLGLSEQRVIVVPKGVVADEYILSAARDLGAPVVSNDRYRDWAAAHPEVLEPGRLIRGGYRRGKLWLEGIA